MEHDKQSGPVHELDAETRELLHEVGAQLRAHAALFAQVEGLLPKIAELNVAIMALLGALAKQPKLDAERLNRDYAAMVRHFMPEALADIARVGELLRASKRGS